MFNDTVFKPSVFLTQAEPVVETAVPTANIRKEESFEEELFLMLYATKY
jgi:hypothetical protein